MRELLRFIPTHVGKTHRQESWEPFPTVHPHACGENLRLVDHSKSGSDSSPRMWGKLPQLVPVCHNHPVHPHACGENFCCHTAHCFPCGSSPRMWGKLSGRQCPQAVDSVHPHACGENKHICYKCSNICGSSPRMWGKRHPRGSHRSLRSVHPHACGENAWRESCFIGQLGSSPRMWGKRSNDSWTRICFRFIPTHVGKTNLEGMGFTAVPVHPHACGENLMSAYVMPPWFGSSPRMWGKRERTHSCSHTKRFIPTHVGKTYCSAVIYTRSSVHPHACGENG